MPRQLSFTVEDLRHNGKVDADKLERVLRQFQQALTPAAIKSTVAGPLAEAIASGEGIDLTALSEKVAALVKPQLEATGSSPINTTNLLGGASLPATFVGYGDSANRLTGEAAFTFDSTNKNLQIGIPGPPTLGHLWLGESPLAVGGWSADASIFSYAVSQVDKNGNITSWLIGDPTADGGKFWSWGSETDSQTGNTKNFAELGGGYWIVNHQGTGTVVESIGLNPGINNTSTGTITLAEGILVVPFTNSGGGTITTAYGIKVQHQNAATQNWDIWSGDERSVLNPAWDYSSEAMSEFVFHKTSTQTKKTALTAHSEVTIVDGVDARLISLDALVRSTHTSGVQNQIIAVYAEAVNVGNGGVSALEGLTSYCENAGGGVASTVACFAGGLANTGGGSITDAKTVWVQANAGTITNNYGIFCEPQTVGTHHYTIWSGDLLSSFGAVLQTYVNDACDVAILTHNRVSALSVIEDSNTIGAGSNREVILVAGESTNASGTKNSNVGIESDTYHTGAGTVAQLYGLIGTWEADAGTVTTATGLQVVGGGGAGHTVKGCGILVDSLVGPGTIDSAYGIYIGSQTAGTVNWSLYTNTGKSSFGDQVNIRSGTLNIETGGSTTISTGVGSVKMSTANPATNTAWIPFRYNGTTYYVPAWTTNAP